MYSEPVEDATQSLDDATIDFARVGPLLLKVLPYRETAWRGLVYNTITGTVTRIDAIVQACVQLPEDHGIVFPGGYYLQNGEHKAFDAQMDGMQFKRSLRSPNGEDVMYVFYDREAGRSALFVYNSIRRALQNPVFGHGYALLADGRMVLFHAEGDAPTRIHPMQVWRTPFTSEEYAAQRPPGTSFMGRIGNAALVRGISDLLELARTIDDPAASLQRYQRLVEDARRMFDAHHWIDDAHCDGAAELLRAISATGESVLDEYEKVEDILDVWFDSGSTHAFTLDPRTAEHGYSGNRPTHWPADLYLEGSDQHRGWFQSSLLEGCGTRGRAPFKAVLTHGFTLDENGEKMSKSRGNTTDPLTIIKESGADILRLWVALVDYSDDQRIGKQILQTTVDAYRKLRNTVRYLLGALAGFEEAERLTDYDQFPPLEKFILHRLWELDAQVRTAYAEYRFQDVVRPVLEFCSGDLSALYFDIRKDALYCDRPDSLRRRAARTVMDEVFARLTAWLAPLTPFTMEEAWTTRFPDAGTNCARVIPDTPGEWRNTAEAERWAGVETVLEVVNEALEAARRDKIIGGALDAWPTVTAPAELLAPFDGLDAAEVFRTSGAELVTGGEAVTVAVDLADHRKCARSWRRVPDVGSDPAYPDLSARDADAVRFWDQTHG